MMLDLIKQLYDQLEAHSMKITHLEVENEKLKSLLAKYTSPHIQNKYTQRRDLDYPDLLLIENVE